MKLPFGFRLIGRKQWNELAALKLENCALRQTNGSLKGLIGDANQAIKKLEKVVPPRFAATDQAAIILGQKMYIVAVRSVEPGDGNPTTDMRLPMGLTPDGKVGGPNIMERTISRSEETSKVISRTFRALRHASGAQDKLNTLFRLEWEIGERDRWGNLIDDDL